MAYPLIILGAGASYDYSPIAKVGPLTKDLVEDHFLLHTLLGKYPGAGDLLSDILLQVKEKIRLNPDLKLRKLPFCPGYTTGPIEVNVCPQLKKCSASSRN